MGNEDLKIFAQIAIVIVTAAVTLGGKYFVERSARRRASMKIFMDYSEPLSGALINLFWRLREMVDSHGRDAFMVAVHPRNEFDNYKTISTYYRLAASIGWMTSIRKELSSLRGARGRRIVSLDEAIEAFEKVLADGHIVEAIRLKRLLKVWGLSVPKCSRDFDSVAAILDSQIRMFLGERAIQSVTALDRASAIGMLERVASEMTVIDSSIKISVSVISQRCDDAIQALAMREAWFYRDWQLALGDLMIKKSQGMRGFEVIGFGAFESMCISPDSDQFRTLKRLESIFDGVKMRGDVSGDHRPVAIRDLYVATIRCIYELRLSPGGGDLIKPGVLQKALECKVGSGGALALHFCGHLQLMRLRFVLAFEFCFVAAACICGLSFLVMNVGAVLSAVVFVLALISFWFAYRYFFD